MGDSIADLRLRQDFGTMGLAVLDDTNTVAVEALPRGEFPAVLFADGGAGDRPESSAEGSNRPQRGQTTEPGVAQRTLGGEAPRRETNAESVLQGVTRLCNAVGLISFCPPAAGCQY